MDCSAIIESLVTNIPELPAELLEIIRHGSDAKLLASISTTALNSKFTERLFIHLEPLFVDICARWITSDTWQHAIPALGRIIWFAPHLAEFAEKFLDARRDDIPQTNGNGLREYLLGLFRLLTFDREGFRGYVPARQLNSLLSHKDKSIRYLSIRVLCQFLQASDAARDAMIKKHIGDEEVLGMWEDKTIDYRFFVLWERQRYERIADELDTARKDRASKKPSEESSRIVSEGELSPLAANLHGILLPRLDIGSFTNVPQLQDLIPTPSTVHNLRILAKAFLEPQPILVTGLSGAGKTRLVSYLAWKLHKVHTLVTLHLNEQTDAKSLLGMYTSGTTPGTFSWRPGVLTTAVREGRWVFIEDLDRAPNEVISTLLPLIERRELIIPGRGETIRATRGFKIIATMRTQQSHRGEEISPGGNMLGARFWRRVALKSLQDDETQDIVYHLYPNLQKHVVSIMAVYLRVRDMFNHSKLRPQGASTSLRPVTLRDLLKWCDRMQALVSRSSVFTSTQLDEFFLEAVDCFAGSMPYGLNRDSLIAIIAEGLQIDPKKRDYLVYNREIKLQGSGKDPLLQIGRTALQRAVERGIRDRRTAKRPFATNGHTIRLMEKIAVAVERSEPLLLVGETGTGKTTCIQHLASQVGRKLVAFNLSQQSETGDLLGGFKPVTIRSMVIPLKDEFDELFEATFSRKNNQAFLVKLGECVAKSKWKAVCKLWKGALSMLDDLRAHSPTQSDAQEGEQRKKRRKLDTVETRWNKFASSVQDLEARLASRSDAFAFAFVEGNIVKAVRNGDWVLLDEINLASADTLEAVADLLGGGPDGTPSLLLTETGSVERVEAHPNFRVFAAMNPATDVGKKDLPPGIRSRFTELYVESPDRDRESLLSIVKTYLEGSEQAIPVQVTDLYLNIQKLAEENRLVDSADQKPHFSLRTLTRTLTYARDIAPLCSLRRALYEGFHMSFLTFLNKPSENLVAPLIKQYLYGKHSNAPAELARSMRKPEDSHHYVANGHYWLRQGAYPPESQNHYIITPFVRRNLDNLIRAASTRRFPVLIQGPTSSGKTSMIEYLAKISGNKFVRINNHEHTDLQEYLGTYISGTDGRLQFQEGVLVKALREGHWIVLDELNLAPTDVLEALNRLLDDNRELLIPETQETVRPHENFMLFATQNPAGLYGGRKVLSRAFRNRFLELHFDDIPIEELSEILHRRTQIPESWSKRIVDVYKKLSDLRQENRIFEEKSFATLRDLFRWALRKADNVEELAINGYMLLAERVRKPEERIAVKNVIDSVMSSARGPHGRINEQILYEAGRSPEIQLYNSKPSSTGVVWTTAMRRLFVLVAHALRNNEPVLLVGETGCGKTTVCQMLADALEKSLAIVNAHQNTETGDLIGAQRPIRNRAATEDELREELICIFQGLETQKEALPTDVPSLLKFFDSLPENMLKSIPLENQATIKAHRHRLSALFEWSDGNLVHAMKTGNLFLLDEISLADDSVLERLNSVLEPQRTLLLAEKGPHNSQIVAAEGFQFLATMNPGGDYGKKELSPALRNRFTEIWVPALSEREDILQIIQAKLHPKATQYAEVLVSFSQWFNGNYNKSAASTISIRDTLAWVNFINRFADQDVVHAVIHGAAMVFIDTLGANPAAIIAIAGSSVREERERCLRELSRLLNFDAASVYYKPATVELSSSHLTIGSFSVPLAGPSESDSSFTLAATTTRNNAMRVSRALQLLKPILLEGSPGVGKTTLVTALAKATGNPLTRINLSEQTDLMDLFGSDVPVEGAQAGVFAWKDAPFLRAMKQGHWVLLDEMNLASQSVLEGLNACLDHRGEVYISELDQTFQRHPEFRVFAAQNPHHQGGGRKGLPASFVNRFTVVYADVFSAEDLLLICKQGFADVANEQIENLIRLVDRLETDFRQHKFGHQGSPWEFNLRDVLRWLHLLTEKSGLLPAGQDHDLLDIIFTQRFRTELDRAYVKRLFGEIFKKQLRNRNYYHNQSLDSFQVGMGTISRSKILQTVADSHARILDTQLPPLESCLIAIQQNWPVILSGSAASGKTTVIQLLAAISGATLTTFSLNADIDAMDLVGGYEQADPTRQQQQFKSRLQAFLQSVIIQCQELTGSSNPDIAARAIESLETLDTLGFSASSISKLENTLPQFIVDDIGREKVTRLLEELANIVSRSSEASKARFEWVDGLLIQALEKGHWLVLDNANLCSSSVLDRLNSLLEPNGFLSINEHASSSGEARIVRPHPQFRIFLTLDPRHGELSRAMRNRAVEIFLLPAVEELQYQSLPAFQLDSAMYRFQNLMQLSSASVNPDPSGLVNVALDHLAIQDASLLEGFCGQVQTGLPPQSLQPQILLQAQKLDYAIKGWVSVDWSFHLMLSSGLLKSTDFSFAQSIHPLNNQYLAQINENKASLASNSANIFDLCLEIANMEHALATVNSETGTKGQLTKLQRSFRAKSSSVSKEPHAQVGNFLAAIKNFVASWVAHCIQTRSGNMALMQPLKDVCRLWHHVFTLTNKVELDNAIFQTHIVIARDTFSQVHRLDNLVGDKLIETLTIFRNSSSSKTGLSMERIWNAFRPRTITSWEQLQSILILESLADRLDLTLWRVRSNLDQLEGLRKRLSETISLARYEEADPSNLIEDLSSTINDIEAQAAIEEIASPFFVEEFELILQYFECNFSSKAVVTNFPRLSLLARRPSKRIPPSHTSTPVTERVSYMLGSILGDYSHSGASDIIGNALGVSLLSKLRRSNDVTLGSLDLLRRELGALGERISANTELFFNDRLESLDVILSCILSALTSAHQDIRPQRQLGDGTIVEQINDADNGLVTILEDLCQPVQEYINSQISSKSPLAAAQAWIHLGLAGLMLYIPDHEFDPALKPRILKEFWNKHRAELMENLAALHAFETTFSGTTQSLRQEKIENEITNLGQAPEAPAIARPPKSELPRLQAEFSNIIHVCSRIKRSLNSDDSQPLVDSTLSQNLRQMINRLSQTFDGYEDLTGPAIVFLRAIQVGLELAVHSSGTQPHGSLLKYLKQSTPFLSVNKNYWGSESTTTFPITKAGTTSSRLHALATLGLAQSVLSKAFQEPKFRENAQDLFDLIHYGWKTELDSEQEKTAANSSLYTYRGGADEQEGQEEIELQEMFPEEENMLPIKPENDSLSPRELATRLTDLHRDIYLNKVIPIDKMKAINRITIEEIAKAGPEGREGVTLQDLFPLIITSVKSAGESTGASTRSGRTYSFYNDPNIVEGQKIASLAQRIHNRFRDIQEIWPEHATLADVLRICKEILSFRYTEPVVKFLTKSEKLHETMHEWEKVASREFSAANLYEDLTNLLISWRQLELSTWARLLDIENEKCEEDAKSWFFVAYETIIVAPKSSPDISAFSQDLFNTLESFFTNTTLGQYAHRLHLLNQMKAHVAIQMHDNPELSHIYQSLHNFLRHFCRFESIVSSEIMKGRQVLEKDVKMVLQLASWRDRNIDALRQSAKRSHQKLFKIVKKYRAVLNRPVHNILAQDLPDTDPVRSSPSMERALQIVPENPQAIEICERVFTNWKARPDRYINLASTVSRMVKMSKPVAVGTDAATYVDSYCDETVSAMAQLRKATPSVLTDENSETVKHLKTRKRKLLSDTLKELRRWGLKSALGGDTLEKQDSLSRILSNLAVLPVEKHTLLSHADDYLHRMLQLMPNIRLIAREHSDDLTPAEVSRCISYVEDLLHHEISQREFICKALQDLKDLEQVIVQCTTLGASDEHSISKGDDKAVTNALDSLLAWMPMLCKYGSEVIIAQAQLGQFDASNISKSLNTWAAEFQEVLDSIRNQPTLPQGLYSKSHESILTSALQMIGKFNAQLSQWRSELPTIGYIVEHLQQWTTKPPQIGISPQENGAQDVTRDLFSDRVQAALDFILGTVQDLNRTFITEAPETLWLLTHNTEHRSAITALRAQTIASKLRSIANDIQYLDLESRELQAATALLTLVLPIVQQYLSIFDSAVNRYSRLHLATSKLSYHFGKSFLEIGRQGFCTPSEKSKEKDSQTENLEGGTGLGEGEGAEDISKDIEDDEDLTELAQEPNQKNENDEIEDEKDAVNMDGQDMEGEMGDAPENQSEVGEDNSEDGEEDDMDSEVGSVDDLGPSAVDEKLWNDKEEAESGKEKEGDQGKGQENEEQVAAQDSKTQEGDTEQQEEEEQAEAGAEESEAMSREQLEQTDPNMKEEETLDLPDDIDMDANKSDVSDESLSGIDDDFPEETKEELDTNMDEVAVEDEPTMGDEMDETPNEDTDDKTRADAEEEEEEQNVEDEGDIAPLTEDRAAGDDAADNAQIEESHAQSAGAEAQDKDQNDASAAAAQQDQGSKSENTASQPQAAGEDDSGTQTAEQKAVGRTEDEDTKEKDAFRKLGDTLERWYRQQRQIRESAKENEESRPPAEDENMDDVDFEHLPDTDAQADAQALGAATEDQAKALDDEMALDVNEDEKSPKNFPDDNENMDDAMEDVDAETADALPQSDSAEKKENQPNAFIGEPTSAVDREVYSPSVDAEDEEDEVEEVDAQLSTVHLDPNSNDASYHLTLDEARSMWRAHESSTRPLSIALTEQLRLILAPTLATKMRGDFRTGKRLNIKRIIPYIASQYKRDKIWMRRSVPSKRTYQIMIALDDSKSMAENGTSELAFKTLALVAKALSMLEAGEISIAGFGENFFVAHGFDTPFSSEGGAEVVRRFGFSQDKTDVKQLVTQSLDLFREARQRSRDSELWQLQIVISDGICEDHESIARFVRQAQEERIMIVFIIVDPVAAEVDVAGKSKVKVGVTDMKRADFSVDAQGNPVLKTWRYLDTFPFRWYLVVRDVTELPGVLSAALRQWFAEVVDAQA